MNFKGVKLYEFKIKDPKSKKIGWLDYTSLKINIVKKKDCSAFKDENTRDAIKNILENNGYKILEIRETNALIPS